MKPDISLVLTVMVLLTAGCSFSPPLTLDSQRITGLNHAEIAATPFLLQDDYQCGPASLAMVMNYYGADITPQRLAPTVFTPDANGSFPAEMDAAIRRQGFISYPVNTPEDLMLEVAAGHPVVTLQNLGVSWYKKWHFAVVVGFDLDTRSFILRSGEHPRLITGMRLFNTTWLRSQRWGRVILPAHQIPATATPLAFLKAASDLEATGPEGAAYPAYAAAVKRWPERPMTQFAMGNYLLQKDKPRDAKTRFLALLKLDPEFAEGWNNFAYTLDALDCPTLAVQAAQCANRLSPNTPAIQNTLLEMQTVLEGGKQPASPVPNQCDLKLTCPR
ncbi:hypothetical protein FT643_20390 [Ketobacter sp. MCCC 1A13808]|uniref:PA2778 family cysteine peptidase n=1 Tax=Ketobacter sp. MCCC 1A13808 TaxID=2602738 RepID=UPI000F1DA144|nr:PA2778 family cysteine peptidase [Ketobacter sp. MCCC 1A13808]MVF14500.1 hypothetical protein [Ketobacter sp. MCCC 1A13808]RLP55030.1 MAG: bacteriocin-processing peptidase family protein [Ketobacter sp.]